MTWDVLRPNGVQLFSHGLSWEMRTQYSWGDQT